MNKLTRIEQECKNVLLQVRDRLSPAFHTKSPRRDFQELMGQIRNAIIHLTNKEFGCLSGYHADHCLCKDDERGKSISWLKKKTGGK